MTANWAFAPVCGFDYWRVVVASPETMIFLFFMITDPKTVPAGRVGRVVFGALVAIVSVLGMATQSDEFGTKVALLAGLVVMCLGRPLIDRLVPAPRAIDDALAPFARRALLGSPANRRNSRPVVGLAAALALALLLPVAIVIAGTPSRGYVSPDTAELLGHTPVYIDPGTLPAITVAQDVIDFDHDLAGQGIQQVLVTLAQNLEVENEALLHGDPALLTAVDHGDRLTEMQARVAGPTDSPVTIRHYQFTTVDVSLLVPFGQQTGLSLGLNSRGAVTEQLYDATGKMISSTTSPFATMFVVRRATGDRWLNVAQLPPR
jgi:hypothetical protein